MTLLTPATVMAGLAPAIHAFTARRFKDVDGRKECGHDDEVTCRGASGEGSL